MFVVQFTVRVCDADEFMIEWARWSWNFRKCFKPLSGRITKNHAALRYNALLCEFYANRKHKKQR